MSEAPKDKLLGWVKSVTGKLTGAPPTQKATPTPAPNPGADAAVKAAAEAQARTRQDDQAAKASKQRMAFIMNYLKNPKGDPLFDDQKVVYQVLTDERSYLQNQIVALVTTRRATTNPTAAAELDAKIQGARDMQNRIFALLKRVSGVSGKTGGSGFLAPLAEPTADQTADDAIDNVSDFLDRKQGS
ncbi:MAG: hypothetical protein JWM80_5811 [Cyanobacteria bacterium RYN_339]|nr:hypothetical protein [Cyanobacteria bacterium RYN_339]